ncbi:unnamed protein product [Rhizoctonia solani]|uniref:Uncharacterized protein n=1 Tax=Rhizoctonia solani TaxID=456999 RepID=A0A8H3ABA1_9AGAM|nr:unnamed protein product [Rhizoctonia solani]
MKRLRESFTHLLLVLLLSNSVIAGRINHTIYDTNTAHITYGPKEDFCTEWNDHVFWRKCEVWAKPWRSEIYHDQHQVATFHRSLDHPLSSMIVEFEGSALWLYGPPRSQLFGIPVEYKVCLHENHRMASDVACYRVNIAEAYSAEYNYEAPVAIFAKGGLQHREHRLVVSVAEPIGETDHYRGIQFSHAVYTTERSTPWPLEEDAWRFRQVITHDTHPLLSYWPRKPVVSGSWRTTFTSGWSSKIYTAEDGTRVSWHELQSRDEEGREQWGVDATFIAGAIGLYGIPKAHITDTDYLSSICVRINSGPCELVDITHAYLNTDHHHEAVLLWKNDALDPDRRTYISVRLIGTGDQRTTVFPFKEFRSYEKQEYANPNLPFGQAEMISIPHDDKAVVYHPGRRCTNWTSWWCSQWFDPWVWKEVAEGLTYRSTVWSYRESEDPSITFEFQGSEIYVYGAPRPLIRDSLASQRVCVNDVCHLIDTEQAYLNAPGSPIEIASSNVTSKSLSSDLQPVLLWSQTGLDDQLHHRLRLELAPLHSKDNAEMTIAKITYTKSLGKARPIIPVPQPDESYEGPLFPPYSEKWAPRPPPPPPPQPEPTPEPEPKPPVSRPEPTQPSVTRPPENTHPTGPPSRPTQPPSHPSPVPEPKPEPPILPDFIGWPLCLLGLAAITAINRKRRADRRRRELQALLVRTDVESHRYYWGIETGYGGSNIFDGASSYGATNHRGTTNCENLSTQSSTTTPGYETQNHGPPPSYTRPPSYRAGPSFLSGTSTNLPSYSDVAREQRVRALRTAAFVAQQRTRD